MLKPIAALPVLLGVWLADASPAGAEQIVLFDITYTHDNSRDSHHQVSGGDLNQPDDWTSPINYAEGTMYFYQEVMTKPSEALTIIDFCFISGGGYGCIETLPYTTTGVNKTERSMAPGGHWYQRNQISFGRSMSSIEMVLKDPIDYINGGDPQSDYLPSMMRFVATLVSPGGTYVPPTPSPGFAPDAGAPDPVDPPDPPPPDPDPPTPAEPPPPSEPPPAVDPLPPAPASPMSSGGSAGSVATGVAGSSNVAGSSFGPTPPPAPSEVNTASGCSLIAGSERQPWNSLVALLLVGLALVRRRRQER